MARNRDGQGSERFSILKVFQRTTKVANAETDPIARGMADDIYTDPLGTASSIRVLYLQKRSREFTQPRALLKVISLDKLNVASSYFAVSYAWGSLKNPRSMTINGRAVQVGENIWHFLHSAQWSGIYQNPLWIDAICINQADVEEKNRQVQMMSRIYKSAGQVIIWLGPHADGSKILFEFWAETRFNVLKFRQRFNSAALKYGPSNAASYEAPHHTYKRKRLERFPVEVSEALVLLCKRTYWKRTWILQECLLGEHVTICCGEHQMDWEMLKESVKLEYSSAAPTPSSHPTRVKDVFEEWMRLDEILTHGEGRRGSAPGTIIVGWKDWYPELFNLLEYIRSTECSDIHDKVFSILSIVQHDPSHNPIHVDYSISIEKLFLHALACWSAGYVTVKIASHLMGILSLDVASLASEIQHEKYLNFPAPEYETSDSVRLEFLLIRLGTVSEITTASPDFVPASKHPITHVNFDGPYSDRLNILGPGWSKERPDRAVGFASCLIAAGDIVYAFMDTTAAIIFRKEEDRLISVAAAILVDPGETRTPEAEEQTYNIAQNLLHSNFLEAGTPPPFELDCAAALEINIGAEPRFAVSILACHSGKHDWPPLRSKLSQRHILQFV